MAGKIINFIKYNNAFTIAMAMVLFGGGAIFAASPDARDAVIGKEIVKVAGIDNSVLLNADIDNLDLRMKVENVREDTDNYYVDYSFSTFGIEGNIWQTISRKAQMIVSKASLAGQDLGLYVQSQLANVAQNEIAYLKQAQSAEKEKGLTQIVRTTEYSGLIGLVLDAKNQILPGYEPVVKPEPSELAQNTEQQQPQPELPLDNQLDQQNATTTVETTNPVQATTTTEAATTTPDNPAPNTAPDTATPETPSATTTPESGTPDDSLQPQPQEEQTVTEVQVVASTTAENATTTLEQ
jgi:hypothetical protein